MGERTRDERGGREVEEGFSSVLFGEELAAAETMSVEVGDLERCV
jgi:hypothetical protein